MSTATSEPVPPYSTEMRTTSSSETSLVRCRPKTMYFHGGIGGAGNYHRVVREDNLDPNHSLRSRQDRSHLPRSLTGFFSSGVGGAGNMHNRGEEASLSPEEEMTRAKIRGSHPTRRWFVGIGGVGNRRDRRQPSPSSDFTSATNDSSFSGRATSIGAAEALKRKLLGTGSR